MTFAKCMGVVAEYRKYFAKLGPHEEKFHENDKPLTIKDKMAHLHSMLDQMEPFLREGRNEKFHRWLGFIQGVLWAENRFTLHELKNHNRPEEKDPMSPPDCVECEELGCPTEGFTAQCKEQGCYKIYCFGHSELHNKKHNRCFCGEKLVCPKHLSEELMS